MPPRAVRRLAAVALVAALGLGVACFVRGLNAESTGARIADGALALVLLVIGLPLTFLIWPRGA